ncbi:hatching enzyme 1.2-like isoform X2 [Hydractinia symbiolongicarpus]|uniref:hatching enzyme 1.2-like isoform X2 n=1 Tax=Hydractinia symbiolongicarpus TaxID=13093 RepID=UPI00254B8AE3|nr:hatching enzyme 1.2-like isoform X2 [Hydractinia symbiolongicarpus]
MGFTSWLVFLFMKTVVAKSILENTAYFEGDIILTPYERENIYKSNRFASTKSRWPTNVIPFDIHPSFGNDAAALANLTMAINDYHKYTCLQFKRRTDEVTYILFYQGQGCGAPLGYHTGQNRISLQGPGCFQKGVIIHEVMHNLGFYHEQSRPDRDKYIRILWNNINPNMKDNFLKRTYDDVDSLGSPYDYLSIMHYPKDGFAKRGTNTIETLDRRFMDKIGQRKGFSKLDIQQVNKMYKCGGTTQTPITAIKPLGCVDVYDRCSSYKRYCSASAWQSFLRKDCKKTCGFCGDQVRR